MPNPPTHSCNDFFFFPISIWWPNNGLTTYDTDGTAIAINISNTVQDLYPSTVLNTKRWLPYTSALLSNTHAPNFPPHSWRKSILPIISVLTVLGPFYIGPQKVSYLQSTDVTLAIWRYINIISESCWYYWALKVFMTSEWFFRMT